MKCDCEIDGRGRKKKNALTLVCKTCELGSLVGPGLNPTPNFGGKQSQTLTSLLPYLTAVYVVVAVDREAVV